MKRRMGKVHAMKQRLVINGRSCCVFEGFRPINPCIFKKTLPNCLLHLPNHPLLFCFVEAEVIFVNPNGPQCDLS